MKTSIFDEIKVELEKYHLDSVANAAEVCPSTLYAWRSGRTRLPRLNTIEKVAAVLGYKIELKVVRKAHLRRVA